MKATRACGIVLLIAALPLWAAPKILIDFGGSKHKTEGHVNNLTDASKGRIAKLVDTSGNETEVGIAVTKPFGGVNFSGTTRPVAPIPGSGSRDTFWGNGASFNGRVCAESELLLSGLISGKAYNLMIFASRMQTKDNRQTEYTITGKVVTVCNLNVASNTAKYLIIKRVVPDAKGTIRIRMVAGEKNTNKHGFFYIGFMGISGPYAVRETRVKLVSAGE